MKKNKNILYGMLVLLCVIAFTGYRVAVLEANVLFPMKLDEVQSITVARDFSQEDVERYTLARRGYGDIVTEQNALFVEYINKLNLAKEDKPLLRYCNELYDEPVLYNIHISYNDNKSKLSRDNIIELYVRSDNKIIIWYEGYEFYDVTGDYYDEFLLLLDELANYCLYQIELQDGTVFKSYEEFDRYFGIE